MHRSAKLDCTSWTLDIMCPPTFENCSSVPYNVRETIIRIIINLGSENTMSILDNKHKTKRKEVQTHCSILNGFLIWQHNQPQLRRRDQRWLQWRLGSVQEQTLRSWVILRTMNLLNVTPVYFFLISHQADKLYLINCYYINVATQSHGLIARTR